MSDPFDITAYGRLEEAWRDIGDRVRNAWRGIIEAEQARGDALVVGGDPIAAHERYQAALTMFRHAQIEAFTAILATIPLLQERLDGHDVRIATLEARAVGETPRVERLEARADIVDRIIFYDPQHPHEG